MAADGDAERGGAVEEGAGRRPRGVLAAVGPGILVAATGVGAGDLATAAFTGAQLGTVVLWAVVLGAGLKYALNEGLARWQLATGTTLLEGAVGRLGRGVAWIFLPYLVLWSFCVGSALMSACGVAAAALVPVLAPATGKVVFGALHGLVGAALVLLGGFRLFERVMGVCIGVMFAVVVVTAALVGPGVGPVARGLLPSAASLSGDGLAWTVALMGGVGGTLTVLSYGYWIREEGRRGLGELRLCRLDLAAGYAMTALFGGCMVVIGSTIPAQGQGATLIIDLAARLEEPLGAWGRWVFLIGAWGAVFSSLLGVWQSVPYLFADFVGLVRGGGDARPVVDPNAPAYRVYLVALTLVPMAGLLGSFKEIQKVYAIVGACFMPLLALTLLLLNGRSAWVGTAARDGWLSRLALGATLVFFGWLLVEQVREAL